MKIKYRNINDELTEEQKAAFITPCGEKEVPEYVLDEDTHELKQVGTINIDDLIQSYKDEVNLANLISRATNGDPSALNRKVGAFIDTIDMPKSLLDAERMVALGSDVLNKLPQELVDRIQSEEDLMAALKDGSLVAALEGKEVSKVESIEERLARLEAASRTDGGVKDE